MATDNPLTAAEHDSWLQRGYFRRTGVAEPAELAAMATRVGEVARTRAGGGDIGDALLQEERALRARPDPAERVSKLFRVHRDEPIFHAFATRPDIVATVAALIGNDIDCFLSQFIFKLPGALGQPWHQDSFYFRFDNDDQVGVWLAVTEAHADNGPLWILPRSHHEPTHTAVRDERPDANPAYVEIVDHDMSAAEPVMMLPGDVLFFHPRLMHRSTDNRSVDPRAAMVYHYARAGTRKPGYPAPPNQDDMPVRRAP